MSSRDHRLDRDGSMRLRRSQPWPWDRTLVRVARGTHGGITGCVMLSYVKESLTPMHCRNSWCFLGLMSLESYWTGLHGLLVRRPSLFSLLCSAVITTSASATLLYKELLHENHMYLSTWNFFWCHVYLKLTLKWDLPARTLPSLYCYRNSLGQLLLRFQTEYSHKKCSIWYHILWFMQSSIR